METGERSDLVSLWTTMPTHLNLLLLEDSPYDAELILETLREAGFELNVRLTDSQATYLRELDQPPDLILSDFSMPQFTAREALRLMNERGLDIPFIVVSGCIGPDMAVDCMKAGASDYLLKDHLTRLGHAVSQALERKRVSEPMIAVHNRERGIHKLGAANEVRHILLVPLLLCLLGSTMSSCAKISEVINTPQIKRAENADTRNTPEKTSAGNSEKSNPPEITSAEHSDRSQMPEIKKADKARTIKTKEWVGHHREELATRRGPPSHEAPLAHGGRSLVYQQQRGSANQRHPRCRTVFITDAQGMIQAAADYAC